VYKNKFTKIGWAERIHHEEDVKEFAGIPTLVNQKVGRENIHWGFYGKPPPEKNPDGTNKAIKDDWQQDVWLNYERILLKGFNGAKNWDIYPAYPTDKYGAFYSNMDIAIAPLQMNPFNDSKSEIKVAEAGRYKIPLIASNVGCYSETIVNGITGYLINPGSPKSSWVDVLTRVIKDKKHRQEMGENLHKTTEENFNLNKMVHLRLYVYYLLLKTKGIINEVG